MIYGLMTKKNKHETVESDKHIYEIGYESGQLTIKSRPNQKNLAKKITYLYELRRNGRTVYKTTCKDSEANEIETCLVALMNLMHEDDGKHNLYTLQITRNVAK